MNHKNNLLLTFDYELFQGKKSGTVMNCLLKPTAKILEILKAHNATAVFFIDMMYLCRLKEAAREHVKAKTDFDLIEQQIVQMAENGHYVFNHIHPHWLDATYNSDKNNWELTNTSKYSFVSLNETERTYVFDSTMNLLTETLQKAVRNKQADGFRAGGLYIQPFSIFKTHFQKHKIQFDFSVLIGAKGALEDNANAFDFSKAKRNMYRFSEEVEIENRNGAYTEYALRFAEITFFPRILNSFFYRLTNNSAARQKFGDGSSTHNQIIVPNAGKFSAMETFSIEMLNEVKFFIYLKELRQNNYLHIISHPKLVSENSLQLFNKLLQKISIADKTEFDFKQFKVN